jgi:hypothetical protein
MPLRETPAGCALHINENDTSRNQISVGSTLRSFAFPTLVAQLKIRVAGNFSLSSVYVALQHTLRKLAAEKEDYAE